jgi:hypothetical protein
MDASTDLTLHSALNCKPWGAEADGPNQAMMRRLQVRDLGFTLFPLAQSKVRVHSCTRRVIRTRFHGV